jgi:hypothetical protein
MVTKVFRKCSICRLTVVSKTTRNFISVECGMGYHIPKTTIPYRTHTLPPQFHDLIFNPKSTKTVSFHSDTKYHNLVQILFSFKHTTSIFRQPPEDASSIFL